MSDQIVCFSRVHTTNIKRRAVFALTFSRANKWISECDCECECTLVWIFNRSSVDTVCICIPFWIEMKQCSFKKKCLLIGKKTWWLKRLKMSGYKTRHVCTRDIWMPKEKFKKTKMPFKNIPNSIIPIVVRFIRAYITDKLFSK